MGSNQGSREEDEGCCEGGREGVLMIIYLFLSCSKMRRRGRNVRQRRQRGRLRKTLSQQNKKR